MLLGVFVGVSLRAFALDVNHQQACKTECHEAGQLAEHGSCGDDVHGPNEECPPDHHHHHHHGFCSHVSPLAVEDVAGVRLPLPGSFLLGLQLSSLSPPASPVFELDKPPLI
jgi:hypothetical protein